MTCLYYRLFSHLDHCSFKVPSLHSQSCLALNCLKKKKESHLYLNLLPLKKMLLLQTVFIWLDFAHLSHAHTQRNRNSTSLFIMKYAPVVPTWKDAPPPPPSKPKIMVHYFKGLCCRSNLHVWLKISHMKHQSTRDGARVHELTAALHVVCLCLWSDLCLAASTNLNSLWFN